MNRGDDDNDDDDSSIDEMWKSSWNEAIALEEEEEEEVVEEGKKKDIKVGMENKIIMDDLLEDVDDDDDDEQEITAVDKKLMENIEALLQRADLKGLQKLREDTNNNDYNNDATQKNKDDHVAMEEERETQEELSDQDLHFIRTVEVSIIEMNHVELDSLTQLTNDYLCLEIIQLAKKFISGEYFEVLSSEMFSSFIHNNEEEKEEENIRLPVLLRQRLREILRKKPSFHALSYLILGSSLLHLYLQANWTGPPLKKEMLDIYYPLPILKSYKSNDPESLKEVEADSRAASVAVAKDITPSDIDQHPELHSLVSREMEVNGVPFYKGALVSHYLQVSQIIFYTLWNPKASSWDSIVEHGIMTKQEESLPVLSTLGWWIARFAAAHQESLEDGDLSMTLGNNATIGLESTKASFVFQSNEQLQARFWVEYSMIQHKLHSINKTKEGLALAMKASGLKVELSGVLGKRTKYQTSDKAQLVLLASSDTTKEPSPGVEKIVENDSTLLRNQQKNEEEEEETDKPSQIGKPNEIGIVTVELAEIDEYTPLREKTQWNFENENQDHERKVAGELSLIDQVIVLGLCVDVKNSYAMEPLTGEEMLAYVTRVWQHPSNWMVHSTSLLQKSHLEFERYKTKERSILQMQVLVDQQTDRLTPTQWRQKDIDDSAPVSQRHLWIHGLCWPPIWQLCLDLGQRYLDLGVSASALEIFTKYKMWEKAIDCLVLMGKNHRAETLARERLAIAPTPNIFCALGNILDDPSYLEKAWELSGKRYSRAKRLLGVQAFKKHDLPKCIEHLKEALAINASFPQTWFRLGVAAMQVSDFNLAKQAFTQVVSQEPTDGDAWGNLCAVLVKLEQLDSALDAITEAVKHSRDNWKMWENYLTLALRNEKWGMAINGINHLIDLRAGLSKKSDKQGTVDYHALAVLAEVVMNKVRLARRQKIDNLSESESALRLQEQYEGLISKIVSECKSDEQVWFILADYYKGLGNFESYRDMLMKRFRVLFQIPDWERSEKDVIKMIECVKELFDANSSEQGASALAIDEVKTLCNSVLTKCNSGPYKDLSCVLELNNMLMIQGKQL